MMTGRGTLQLSTGNICSCQYETSAYWKGVRQWRPAGFGRSETEGPLVRKHCCVRRPRSVIIAVYG